MSNLELDALTTFLHGRGESTEVEYFGQSEFVIGRRLRRREFEVVYRQDGNEVVIADFITREGCDDVDAVSAFIRLIHWIERELPDLYRVRGLFVRTEAQPQLNQVRERLSRVLERKGAHWQMIEGDAWLVYPLQAARDNRR
ncbi:secretion protein [Pseudomonas sp. IPO3774]|uniref:secretion protein n=1 Tax=Pseudomonas sp. IPO3774 TaxID=2738826 RepID=UPI0015A3A052|nr:secretion protein [Pseudomonas sp. IPO3774]NWD64108.1 secretion protein [Pseudomonas sp. IPO3774]